MFDRVAFKALLAKLDISFISGVPDTLLNDLCLFFDEPSNCEEHIICANEGSAVAVAAGAYLASGNVPLVYLQNSGIGSIVNPLTSLVDNDMYGVPMIILVGWRGHPAKEDHVQHHKIGRTTQDIFHCLNFPTLLLDDPKDVETAFKRAHNIANEHSAPCVILVSSGVFEKGYKEARDDKTSNHPTREQVMEDFILESGKQYFYLATTGRAARELSHLCNIHQLDGKCFFNAGAMGYASSIATGIAKLKPEQKVICFDGDGSFIMHMGTATMAGTSNIPNLLHVVLNNYVHDSVGGQPTSASAINITEVAEAIGYNCPRYFDYDIETCGKILENFNADNSQASFVEIKVKSGLKPSLPELKRNFRDESKKIIQNLVSKRNG